ncbi:post-transcriptional regulator Mkt1p [[Candida] anglica]|uniref:Post-transcriptional regulator Mkt1p n=1 Tax=[Candida] anglica TaxID=148631 RepID=A0ABP0E9X8_9ASCO
MPIKSLESYLFERRVVSASSIEILQNATIGIDVEHYLSRIYTFKKEQYLAGVGGTPSSLKDYVQSDLQVFKEFNIKPIFVIPGLGIESQHAEFPTNELSPQESHRMTTWNKLHSRSSNPYLYNNSNTESFRLFTDPLPLRPMINDLIRYFIANGIDYLISPYDASFQLSYLYNTGLVDSIYGSTDVLLCNVDKFILGMEFLTKEFRYIERAKVLYELGLSEKQFTDLSIMVGCNLQPVTFPNFPPLPKPNHIQPYPQLNYFKLGLEIIFQLNSYSPGNPADLYAYIVSLNDPKLLELYYKGHSALKYLPILNKEGYVELYSVEMNKLNKKQSGTALEKIEVPNDVHAIISQKLPPELYFYQSLGLLPLSLLEAITQGKLNIRPPPDGGLPESYKKLISSKYFNDSLDFQFNLITQLLARYYQVKKISVDYWFKDGSTELNNRLTPPAHVQISHLWIHNSGSKKFDLPSFISKLTNANIEENSCSEREKKFEISTNSDIISTALLRSLYLLGVVENKTNKLSSVGNSIHRLVKEFKDITEDEVSELFLILLLIKSKVIKLNDQIRDYYSIPKSFKDPISSNEEIPAEDAKHITLLSRILSVHKLNISAINYQGPISRSLQSFRSHVKVILNNLSNTLQCCLLDLSARNDIPIRATFETRAEWYELVNQLPFYKDCNNTLLGVVGEIYFEYSLRQRIGNQNRTKEEIISNTKDHLLNSIFQVNNPSFNINVKGANSIDGDSLFKDFKNGLNFWSKFIKLVEIIHEEDKSLIDDKYYKSILETDTWMKQYI